MTSKEFILIPRENCVKEQPKTSEVLYDPTIDEKAKLLTMLQREDYQTKPKEKPSEEIKRNENQNEIIERRVLKSLSMMKPSQLERSRTILKKIYDASDISVDDEGFLKIGENTTAIEATNLLYNLQQSQKRLHDPDYKTILEKLNLPSQLVANSDAKNILKPTIIRKK